MKKIIFFQIILVLIIFPALLIAQQEKEIFEKKQAQSEIKADVSNYVIGPEDVLYIHVWREDLLSRTVPVRMDGNISLPLIDEIQAAGLTPLQLKDVLVQKLKKFIDEPNVSVIVMEANSHKVYISGQVRTPGVYRLRSETTILQIIPMAGGFTEWANQKKILVIRREGGKEKRIIINYKKIIEGQEREGNLVLKPGDTIIVP